jgi:hypothetical protein
MLADQDLAPEWRRARAGAISVQQAIALAGHFLPSDYDSAWRARAVAEASTSQLRGLIQAGLATAMDVRAIIVASGAERVRGASPHTMNVDDALWLVERGALAAGDLPAGWWSNRVPRASKRQAHRMVRAGVVGSEAFPEQRQRFLTKSNPATKAGSTE